MKEFLKRSFEVILSRFDDLVFNLIVLVSCTIPPGSVQDAQCIYCFILMLFPFVNTILRIFTRVLGMKMGVSTPNPLLERDHDFLKTDRLSSRAGNIALPLQCLPR